VHRAALRRLFFEILQRGTAESRKLNSSAFAKASAFAKRFRRCQGYGGLDGGQDGGQVDEVEIA
jgi:hypothetical protein